MKEDRFKEGKTQESREREKNIFTPEKAAQLLFLSFKYSQGNDLLQRNLFRYLALKNPEWSKEWKRKSDEEVREFIDETVDSTTNFSKRYIDKGRKLERNKAGDENGKKIVSRRYHKQAYGIQREVERMADYVINSNLDYSDAEYQTEEQRETQMDFMKYKTMHDILSGMIEKYTKFLIIREDGRPRSEPDTKVPSRDPFLSHVIHYVLRGKNAGVPEYNEMFGDIRKALMNLRSKPPEEKSKEENSSLLKLDAIIDKYNKEHPDNPFSWEDN